MIYHDQDFIFTHNLDYLMQLCSQLDKDFTGIDMKNINLYAVRARYPHDYIAAEPAEAREYYEIAVILKPRF
ncbi:hypothetical protein FW774_12820 [Pedobacter sp. BS3]|nr:hypothetical protein FW774_12820 [Pedobacter sp. BS3]